MKEKLAIYPFSEEMITILEHQNKIQDYELTYAVIPKGWEPSDESLEQYKELICFEEIFYSDNLINSIDILLLCKPRMINNFSMYNNMIAIAEKNNKRIMYVYDLEHEVAKQRKKDWFCLRPEKVQKPQNSELLSIDIPVIMIFGLGDNCEKWDLQLGLYDYFNQKGYKASLISRNGIAQIMGIHNFPLCLDNSELTFSQQVKSLNAFAKKIELEENPDLIIVDVPGGIMKYSPTIPNGYGYLPFMICNAILPDISILSLYCGEYGIDSIKEIQSACIYRFSAKVDYFHISKKVCNYDIETKQMIYYSVENPYFLEKIIRPQENLPAFNILDQESREKVFDNIMNELQNNIAAV